MAIIGCQFRAPKRTGLGPSPPTEELRQSSLGFDLAAALISVLAPVETGRNLLSRHNPPAEITPHRLLVGEDLDLPATVGARDRLGHGLSERASTRAAREHLNTSSSMLSTWDAELLIFTPYGAATMQDLFNTAKPINITPANRCDEETVKGHSRAWFDLSPFLKDLSLDPEFA